MNRIRPSAASWPLLGRERTRRIEREAQDRLPPHALIQRAGAATARLALALAPHSRCIGVVAGGGNNGGDGIEAALCLQAAGKAVEVMLCGDPERFPPDAKASLAAARSAGVPLRMVDEPGRLLQGADFDFLIDALLGIGASRSPVGHVAACIEQLNSAAPPVLAIDLPSGLDADTGQPLGDACVRASHTLSLLSLKPGLWTGRGRDFAGEVWFESLQLDESALAAAADAVLLGPPPTSRRPELHASHKGSYGDVGVVGGAHSMIGAALLAARAAHAAGAGRVFVDLLGDRALQADPGRPELMLRPDFCRQDRRLLERMTVVAGCGGGAAVRAELPRILSIARRLVVDADALNAVASDPALSVLLRARAARGRSTVLTPHPLEAARLLDCDVARIQADRLAAASALAERCQCVVVLKGSGSVIAAPGQTSAINPTGNSALATAGTGDVLAGWLAGLWSGSYAANDMDVHVAAARAAAHAVWLHGAAADSAGLAVLRADDLIERLALVR